MNWSLFASLTVTAAIAVLGYFAKYLSDVHLEQRRGLAALEAVAADPRQRRSLEVPRLLLTEEQADRERILEVDRRQLNRSQIWAVTQAVRHVQLGK